MMKGSTVVLAPGVGKTITFNGSIADDSSASITSSIPTGKGAGLTVQDGLVIFNGDNTYTGQTKIADGGVLQAMDGNADHPTLSANSNINLAGGIFQSNGLFNRYLGTASNRVQWTASGGFAAVDSDLTVSLNNNAALTWGQANFVSNSNALLFGSTTATNEVNFTNNLVLNAGNHTILATANADNSDIARLSGNITGTGGLTINDAGHTGIVLLNGQNTYSGGTTLGGGTLALGSTGSLNTNGALTVNTPAVFDISQAGSQAIGTLGGTGNVKLGANTLTLNQNADTTFSGVIADGGMGGGVGGGLTKLLSGTLTLSGANTYTGTTQVSAGTLDLTGSLTSKTVNIASGASFNDVNAGLDTTAALTNAGTVTLGANDTIASFTNNAGTLNGTGNTLTATTYALNDGSVVNANLGTGTMTNNGTVALNGTSDAATVNIASGTTTLGAAERLLDTSAVTVAENSNLVLGGAEKIGSLTGAGNVDLTVGGLTVDSGNFSGVLQSSNATYGLTKVSAGTLALSGANTYTGATQINAGTMDLTGSLASNTVNVASGATLNDTNAGLAATAAVTNAGTVMLGANDTVASLTNSGTLNGAGKTLTAATYALNNGSVINANLGAGTMTTGGTVTLNGTSAAGNINVLLGSILNLGDPLNTTSTLSHLTNPAAAVALNGTMNLYGGNEYIQSLQGAGVVNLRNNALFINNGGAFTGNINGANTNLNVNGGSLSLNIGATTAKTINIANGSNVSVGNTTTVNAQTLSVDGGSTLNVTPGSTLNYTLLNGGTASQPGGTINAATFTNSTGSTVGGFLNFTGNFVNNGTLSPGNSPGMVTIAGNFINLGSLKAEFETNTKAAGVGYDQIRIGGTSTLGSGSTLAAATWNGITPQRGDSYQILANSTGGAIRSTGAFDNVTFTGADAITVNNAAVVFDVNSGRMMTTGLNAPNSTFAGLGRNANQSAAISALMAGATRNVGVDQIDRGCKTFRVNRR